MECIASDPLKKQLDLSEKDIHSHWKWTLDLSYLNNFEFSLPWRVARNTLPLANMFFKVCTAEVPDCTRCLNIPSSANRSTHFGEHVGEVSVCIDPKQNVQLDVAYIVHNIDLPRTDRKRKVLLAIPGAARIVIWTIQLKRLYNGVNFSYYDPIRNIVYFLAGQRSKT